MIAFDHYSLNPELEHLKNTGTATVWRYDMENSKRAFYNSTIVSNQNYSLNDAPIRSIRNLQELTDNWDGEEAVAPNEKTINSAVAIAKNLDLAGQKIYHTSPGPNGEILISLRKNEKNVELLVFANKSPKVITISDLEEPTQALLTSESLQIALSWLNA